MARDTLFGHASLLVQKSSQSFHSGPEPTVGNVAVNINCVARRLSSWRAGLSGIRHRYRTRRVSSGLGIGWRAQSNRRTDGFSNHAVAPTGGSGTYSGAQGESGCVLMLSLGHDTRAEFRYLLAIFRLFTCALGRSRTCGQKIRSLLLTCYIYE